MLAVIRFIHTDFYLHELWRLCPISEPRQPPGGHIDTFIPFLQLFGLVQDFTGGFCWWWGRQAMIAMKENVATRMAAHERMKMMWLPAVETVLEKPMNDCLRMEEGNKCNLHFCDLSYFHFKYEWNPHVMGTSRGKKRTHLHSHFCSKVWNYHLCAEKGLGKKESLTTMVSVSEDIWPLQRSLEKKPNKSKLAVRRFTFNQRGEQSCAEHTH